MFLAFSSWAANVDTLFVVKDSKIADKFAINAAFDSIAVSKTDDEYQLGFFKGQNAVKNIALSALDSVVFYRPVFATASSSSVVQSDSSVAQPSSSSSVDNSSSSESEDTPVINGKITDARDGNIYNVAEIGTQTWMAENLRYLPSLNGVEYNFDDPKYYIFNYTGTDVEEAKTSSYYQTYGVLYNWLAAIEACPAGWHLPTNEEWSVLEDYAGDRLVVGIKLKANSGWDDYGNGTDAYGFSALPGGYFTSGGFRDESDIGEWWSGTWSGTPNACSWRLHSSNFMFTSCGFKSNGYSVRCLKD